MWCEELQQHINVGIEDTNHLDWVIIDKAISNLEERCNTDLAEIRRLAQNGDLSAIHIIEASKNGDPVAIDYLCD